MVNSSQGTNTFLAYHISWNLPYLDTLDRFNNFFSNPFPDSLPNLTRLWWLGLLMNSFSDKIPTLISSLTELVELYLDNNKLEGEIPASFNNLVSLKRLELQSNKLTCKFPKLGSLKKFSFLDASNNAIFGKIPWVFPSSLVQISMRNNSLEGTIIPENFRTLGYLQVINIIHNRLSGSVPSLLYDLLSLQQLTLSFNLFSSVQAPASLGTQSELIAINLSNNKLRGFLPLFMALMPRLSALSWENNKFTGMMPT